MIKTAGQLIDALGGNRAVAAVFGVEHNTISTWRARGFPAWACLRLREAARAAALKIDEGMFEKKPRAKSAACASADASLKVRAEGPQAGRVGRP